MIDFNFTEDCCGCRVCCDACPKSCISFITNKYGWVIPHVKKELCINCHICEKMCPALSYKKPSNVAPQLYSAFSTDSAVRETGSSGSIFYHLAKFVLDCDGVVYGAAFDDNLRLKHTGISSIHDIKPLTKSKYLQSDTTGIYKDVLSNLKKKKMVLFVGTPCQIAALHGIVPKSYKELLISVDFICHGTPGQELFDKSIAEYEKRTNSKVLNFSFRKKTENSLHSYSLIRRDYATNTIIEECGNSRDFPYYCGYLKYYTFRDACYKCKYLGKERISDITLGDFWFLDKIKPINDFNKGYSMLIVNSEKGHHIVQNLISTECIETEEFPIEVAEQLNYAYTHPTHMSIVHRLFKRDYTKLPYKDLEKRYFTARQPFFKKCIRYIIHKYDL